MAEWITSPYGLRYQGDSSSPTRYMTPDGKVYERRQDALGNVTYDPIGDADPSAPTPPTQDEQSAKAILDGALGQFGLSSLSDWAWHKWQGGETIEQIFLELRDTPEYKQRFPAMGELSKRGRAISEAQYINYEQSASAIFKAAGLPPGFYDGPEDFGKFLVNDIALPELQDRVSMYKTAAYSQPPEVLDAWHNLYGLDSGDLLAFFIDPDKAAPLIQKKFAAVTAAGYSNLSGFGALDASQAEMVGDLGLTDQALAQQFGELAAMNPLFDRLQGTTETDISRDTALRAGFQGNAQDQALIAQRKAQRLNQFAGGGQVATTQQGAVGAGSAR